MPESRQLFEEALKLRPRVRARTLITLRQLE